MKIIKILPMIMMMLMLLTSAFALTFNLDTMPVIDDANNVVFTIKNSELFVLNPLDVVYIVGSDGNALTAGTASAAEYMESGKTICVVRETIGIGSTGDCVRLGRIDNVNTIGLSEGETLFLSEITAGKLREGPPAAGYRKVRIGYSVREHAINGAIDVDIQSIPFLNGLNDVNTTETPDNGTVLYRDNDLWIAKDLNDDYYTQSYIDTLISNYYTGAYILNNFYNKSETYSSSEVDALPVSTFSNDAGYITSYTETDPVWNAAKAGYVTTNTTQTVSGEKTFSNIVYSNDIRPSTSLSSDGWSIATSDLQPIQFTGIIPYLYSSKTIWFADHTSNTFFQYWNGTDWVDDTSVSSNVKTAMFSGTYGNSFSIPNTTNKYRIGMTITGVSPYNSITGYYQRINTRGNTFNLSIKGTNYYGTNATLWAPTNEFNGYPGHAFGYFDSFTHSNRTGTTIYPTIWLEYDINWKPGGQNSIALHGFDLFGANEISKPNLYSINALNLAFTFPEELRADDFGAMTDGLYYEPAFQFESLYRTGFFVDSNDAIILNVNDSRDTLVFATNGYIGIGDTTPDSILDIEDIDTNGYSIRAKGDIEGKDAYFYNYYSRTEVDNSSNALETIPKTEDLLNPDGSINHAAFGDCYETKHFKDAVTKEVCNYVDVKDENETVIGTEYVCEEVITGYNEYDDDVVRLSCLVAKGLAVDDQLNRVFNIDIPNQLVDIDSTLGVESLLTNTPQETKTAIESETEKELIKDAAKISIRDIDGKLSKDVLPDLVKTDKSVPKTNDKYSYDVIALADKSYEYILELELKIDELESRIEALEKRK